MFDDQIHKFLKDPCSISLTDSRSLRIVSMVQSISNACMDLIDDLRDHAFFKKIAKLIDFDTFRDGFLSGNSYHKLFDEICAIWFNTGAYRMDMCLFMSDIFSIGEIYGMNVTLLMARFLHFIEKQIINNQELVEAFTDYAVELLRRNNWKDNKFGSNNLNILQLRIDSTFPKSENADAYELALNDKHLDRVAEYNRSILHPRDEEKEVEPFIPNPIDDDEPSHRNPVDDEPSHRNPVDEPKRRHPCF